MTTTPKTATNSPPISVGLGLGFGLSVADGSKGVVIGEEVDIVGRDTCIGVDELKFLLSKDLLCIEG